ncbi:alpha/beta hydrolase [Pseudomonas sp. zjy_14]|uniref:alpha/beta hydrolase n=1 Tax=Pseudomonas sp. zjy_14 TaxID=3367264 RepID=UPI00370AF02B
MYLHGGGWDIGYFDIRDWSAYGLAQGARLAIFAVDCHACPAPLEDCLNACATLRKGEVAKNHSQTRLMVACESAGGKLAAGLCMALRRGAVAGLPGG